MDLEITVRARGQHWSGSAGIVVPEPMYWAFEPLKTTDEPVMAFVAGEVMRDSEEVQAKMQIREDAAKYLAEAITKQLLSEMQKADTHNGYS